MEQAARAEKREEEERVAKEAATRRLESVAREARERQLKVREARCLCVCVRTCNVCEKSARLKKRVSDLRVCGGVSGRCRKGGSWAPEGELQHGHGASGARGGKVKQELLVLCVPKQRVQSFICLECVFSIQVCRWTHPAVARTHTLTHTHASKRKSW